MRTAELKQVITKSRGFHDSEKIINILANSKLGQSCKSQFKYQILLTLIGVQQS